MSLSNWDLSNFFMRCSLFYSLMDGMLGGELVNDNSQAVYNYCPLQKVKEDLNQFCCHLQASCLIVYQTNR